MKLHRWDLQEDNTMPSCSPNIYEGKHHIRRTLILQRKSEKVVFPKLKIIKISKQNSFIFFIIIVKDQKIR